MQTLRKKVLSKLATTPQLIDSKSLDQEFFAESVFNRSKIQK